MRVRVGGMVLVSVALLFSVTAAPVLIGEAGAAGQPSTGFMETNGTVKVGQTAPLISGEDLDGGKVGPESFNGRPIFMDFSSIFCGSCQETIKEFKRLQDVYKGTDLALIIVVDGAAPPQTLKNYFKNLGATYTVIRDKEYKLFESYGVTMIPFQAVIGRDGKIRKIHIGFNPEMESAMGLKELVKRQEVQE